MEKKGVSKLIVILVLIILFVIFYFGFGKLTGRVVDERYPECTDSDGGKQNYVKGTTTGKGALDAATKNFTDFCFNNPNTIEPIDSCKGFGCKVNEYYCGIKNLVYKVELLCPKGCQDGKCLSSSTQSEEVEEENITEEIDNEEQQEEVEDEVVEEQVGEPEPASPAQISLFDRIINFFKDLFR